MSKFFPEPTRITAEPWVYISTKGAPAAQVFLTAGSFISVTDPADARMLAAKLNEAADALELAQARHEREAVAS